MNLRGHPWESVFNFVMFAIIAGAVLGTLWILALQRHTEGANVFNLGGLTLMYFGFVGPRIIKWFSNDAR